MIELSQINLTDKGHKKGCCPSGSTLVFAKYAKKNPYKREDAKQTVLLGIYYEKVFSKSMTLI